MQHITLKLSIYYITKLDLHKLFGRVGVMAKLFLVMIVKKTYIRRTVILN